jgi:hypothetical protein
MRSLITALFATLALTSLPAQTANDVGLTMSGGILTVIYGHQCGTVSCTPMTGGTVAANDTRTVTVYGNNGTPYILGIGLPGVCFPFPGIANMLLLNGPLTLAVGVTTNGPSTSTCRVGPGRFTLNIPPNAPTGWSFRLQALATSFTAGLAFTNAIEVTL